MSNVIEKAIGSLPLYWKLATARCAIYAGIVAWGVFKAGVNGFDSLSDMTSLQLTELAGDMLFAALAVWLAFLDNTMTKVQGSVSTNTVTVSEVHTETPAKKGSTTTPIDQQPPKA